MTATNEASNENGTLNKWITEKEAVERLGNQNWFKPQADETYQVKFLDEGADPVEKTFEDRTIEQVDFQVEVTGGGEVGAEHIWSVTKGGPDSCYGKLVNIFAHLGTSKGVTVEVTAVGDGKSRRYLVRHPEVKK